MVEPRIESVEMQIKLAREEVRFWQTQLIQASFWLTAGALAIVAFVLNMDPRTVGDGGRVFSVKAGAGGVLAFAIAYQVIASHAKDAIKMNHLNLRRLEKHISLDMLSALGQSCCC